MPRRKIGFRSAIRSSRNHLIVGIDIAKDKHHAFLGTAYGKTFWKRLLFSNDKKGYMRLIEQVNALKFQHQLDQIVFEWSQPAITTNHWLIG